MKWIWTLLMVFSCGYVVAQDTLMPHIPHKKIQILGKITDRDSHEPIRNTHIISKMAHCGTISNTDGIFIIPAYDPDTLWISCIGFARRLIPIDEATSTDDTMMIELRRDTILMKEVVVWPFTNYENFKDLFVNMPSIGTLDELERLRRDLDDPFLRRPPRRDADGNIAGGLVFSPIQALYDKFNASARRERKLLRNRMRFNEILREHGRTDEILPDSMDYWIDYNFQR